MNSTADAVAQFRLVRCNAHHTEMCLSAALSWPSSNTVTETLRWSGELLRSPMVGPEQLALAGAPGATESSVIIPVFATPVWAYTSIGRVALSGTIALRDSAGAALFSAPASWRPPRVAWPLFTGVADERAVPVALREALAIAAEPPSARTLISLLLLLSGIMLLGFVPRYLWQSGRESDEDIARQLAAARALLTSHELDLLRDNAPLEAAPRDPDESTAKAIEKRVSRQ
ncbi:MAG: hypothetical protein ABJB74_00370 [Gemmatimonas sp.]